MADKRDYYDVLGVPRGASEEDLKKAYRNMAKKHHPDANPGNEKAEAAFKEVNEAYAILSDSQKRAAYDQMGHAAFEQGGSGFTDFDMNDIFESFFGGSPFGDIFGGGGGRKRNGPRRGADLATNIQVSFNEAIFGTDKEVRLAINDTCDTCSGSGAKPGTLPESCKKCGGSGQERITAQTILGSMTQVRTCSSCKGSGRHIKDPCSSCKGAGKVRKHKNHTIKVLAGIDHGQTLRLGGKGEPGERGGPPGDLLITVYVEPSREYKREGMTLHKTISLSFAQAALGADIQTKTPYGNEDISVKPGTQTGTQVRLKGKGVPHVQRSNQVGDLVLTLQVVTPTGLNEHQKDLLRQLDESPPKNEGSQTKSKKGFFGKLKE